MIHVDEVMLEPVLHEIKEFRDTHSLRSFRNCICYGTDYRGLGKLGRRANTRGSRLGARGVSGSTMRGAEVLQ